jgi:hypothetical protein
MASTTTVTGTVSSQFERMRSFPLKYSSSTVGE